MNGFRFSIRALMILIAAAGLLGWAAGRSGMAEFVGQLWPVILMAIAVAFGWIRTIVALYKSPPEKQALWIISLIFLVAATALMPLWPLLFGFRYEF
jgi:hypothetical protein